MIALNRIVRIFLAPVLLLAWLSAAQGAPDSLSAEQKAEVERIVRAYLLANPDILVEMSQALEARRKAEAQAKAEEGVIKHQAALYANPSDYVANPDGRIPVVEFFDYNCGFCKRVLPAMLRLKNEMPDVRIIFKEFPILTPSSMTAARAAIAARRQGKYLELHNALMESHGTLDDEKIMVLAEEIGLDMARLRQDMAAEEVQAEIDANRALGDALDIRGTPTLLIGDSLVPGAISFEQMAALVDQARDECRVC